VTAFALLTRDVEPPALVEPGQPPVEGLPRTPDYHSLLVSRDYSRRILLGTHDGVFESADGGETWQQTTLAGEDAMTLEAAHGSLVWAAGHGVLAISDDGGDSWKAVRPEGLPTLDIHAFTIDPTDSRNVYAAVAGKGLYRSRDGGTTFSLVTAEVGGDSRCSTSAETASCSPATQKPACCSARDGGEFWQPLEDRDLGGLALHPADPNVVLVGGSGLFLSEDGGRSFQRVLDVTPGAGPVAWSPNDVNVAYAVGLDRVLYRTLDGGETWEAVA
jgi:photosystem II stability/assembly factor-like uncharacterized protein